MATVTSDPRRELVARLEAIEELARRIGDQVDELSRALDAVAEAPEPCPAPSEEASNLDDIGRRDGSGEGRHGRHNDLF